MGINILNRLSHTYRYSRIVKDWRFYTFVIVCINLLLQQSESFGDRSSEYTPDANTVVRKMVLTYQSAQTVQEKSEAKMQDLKGQEFYQTSTVKFRRPNLLYISSTDPKLGTYSVYCNGKTVTMYTGTQNIFTKRDAPTNLRKTVQSLYATGMDLLNIPVTQMLNPVSFMSADGLPDECKKYRYIREDIIDGRHVFVVGGQADPKWAMALIPLKDVNFLKRDITLWIDASRFLLLKASCNVVYSFEAPAKEGQQGRTLTSNLKFTETHRDIALNIPIREETFFFQLPKGAVEKYQERK